MKRCLQVFSLMLFMLIPILSTTQTVSAACSTGEYYVYNSANNTFKCEPINSTAGQNSVKQETGKIQQYIENSLAGLIGVAVALSALMTVYGGLLYAMSEGDQKKVQNAKVILIGAGVGAAIAVSSYVILAIIKNIVGF